MIDLVPLPQIVAWSPRLMLVRRCAKRVCGFFERKLARMLAPYMGRCYLCTITLTQTTMYYFEICAIDEAETNDDCRHYVDDVTLITLDEAKQYIEKNAATLPLDNAGDSEWYFMTLYCSGNNPEGADTAEYTIAYHPSTHTWAVGTVRDLEIMTVGYSTIKAADERSA